MNVNKVKTVIEFSRDWNSNMDVKEMAKKYAISVATVRSRVSSLRKQGVKLVSRKRGINLSDSDVAAVNKELLR